ncbi:MAG: hypothetical protein ACI8RZ_005265 [Myxococcota bacterium]|jgi:hypothetical protein
MRFTRLLTALALLGFSLACGGGSTEEAAPTPAPAPAVEQPAAQPTAQPAGVDPSTIDYNEDDMAADDPFTHFVNSSYSYCDAKVLGAMWGEDTYTAKSSIGQLLMQDERDRLDDKLTGCRERALEQLDNREIRCHYDDVGVTYDDAVALAGFWGIDSWEAKMRVEEKYLRDGHSNTFIKEALRMARDQGGH